MHILSESVELECLIQDNWKQKKVKNTKKNI